MILKKRYKIRLTKFGKLFFSGIFGLTVLILRLAFINHQRVFYEKDENKNYIVEINYPKVKSKQLLAYTDDYIKNKKKEFKEEISMEEPLNSSKYEFKADYKITDDNNNNILGLHLNINEYTGGAHYVRYDKSYYYNKESDEIVSLKDFLEKDTSLDKLANLSYYYVMKYSDDNNLNFDKEGVKEGLSFNLNNFEHFNFIDDGLEFIFPPYQVAYYAAGEIKIVIPYDELNGIIKNKYLKYSKKNNIKQDNNRNLKEFSNKKLIAFTFDDGPRSGTTDIILNVLKEKGIKATFFVTSGGPDDLIKRAYDEGHSIGLHTSSHDYSVVYSSVDSYFKDLKVVSDRVERITGEKSTLIRFPGGSSNTISRRYSSGIMSCLTQEVVKRGYRYYDWNIDSRDAEGGRFDSSQIANFVTSSLSHDKVNMVLMHDIKVTTKDAIGQIIDYGKANGYTFEAITPFTDMVTQRVNN